MVVGLIKNKIKNETAKERIFYDYMQLNSTLYMISSRSIAVMEIYICRWREFNILCGKPNVTDSIMDTTSSYLRSVLIFVGMN